MTEKDPFSNLKEKVYLFQMEQEMLCNKKLEMLKKMYKDSPRPLTFNDFCVRGYKCNYNQKDIIN